ncbi:MAG: hypothetical protein AAGF07_01885, partial [Patescibacteria group bacterium]
DGTPDYRDLDSDNDNLLDADEKGSSCTNLTDCIPVDTDSDGIADYRELFVPVVNTTVRSGGIALTSVSAVIFVAGSAYLIYKNRKSNKLKLS